MNCNCITKVNNKLDAEGLEYHVDTALVFDKKMVGQTRLEVPTHWVDVTRRNKKKPPSILCTFCPFCGKKATNDDSN